MREHLESAIELGDGRRLTFALAGRDAGFPIIYLHGAIGAPRWLTHRLETLLAQHAIRYVLAYRPGFAGSDPLAGRSVLDFAGDVAQLADALGFQKFSVVGVSSGAPYALGCSCALADRIEATAVVSPLPPRGSRRYAIPKAAFGTPLVGPLVGSTALTAMGLRRATPARAMSQDYAVVRRDWGFELEDVRTPVTVWHGSADRLVPLEHAIAIANRLPEANTVVAAGHGHFFYRELTAEVVVPLLPEPADRRLALAA